jgi:hypothetical protein
MVLLWNAHNWIHLFSVALYIHTTMDNTKALCLWSQINLPSSIYNPSPLFSVCKCLKCRLVCHDVHKTSWLVHRCSKIDPMSCNYIMRHQKISRDKCACDKRDIYKCSWFCARGFTQAISKHDQLEKCIWWWTDVLNLTEKRYQCPRSAHESFSMRSVFHLWSFS